MDATTIDARIREKAEQQLQDELARVFQAVRKFVHNETVPVRDPVLRAAHPIQVRVVDVLRDLETVLFESNKKPRGDEAVAAFVKKVDVLTANLDELKDVTSELQSKTEDLERRVDNG